VSDTRTVTDGHAATRRRGGARHGGTLPGSGRHADERVIAAAGGGGGAAQLTALRHGNQAGGPARCALPRRREPLLRRCTAALCN